MFVKMSDSMGEIFTALSQAQGLLENVSKDTNGHNYKYADLGTCIDAAKNVLPQLGLSVIQSIGSTDSGQSTIITMLCHSSGQYVGSETIIPQAVLSGGSAKNPVQCLGSAITYMRRYCYCSIIGLTQVDDDASNMQSPPKLVNATQIKSITENLSLKGYDVETLDFNSCFGVISIDQIEASNFNAIVNGIKSWSPAQQLKSSELQK